MEHDDFVKMTPWERDTALLALITKLATVTELQGEALGALDDRVTTLELSSDV